MQEGASYVPSLREYTARWGVTPERLRPGQKVMHPGPMNRGVEIDPRRRRLGRLADRDPGASGARRPHGRALRPAHARARSPLPHWRSTRWPDALGEGRAESGRRHPRRPRPRPGRRASTTFSTSASTTARSPRSARELDANGHSVVEAERPLLAPAFVDPHVHLRTPGREDEETIASGTAAAAAGGYCAILAMPNTDPVVDSASVLRSLARERAPGGRAYPWGSSRRSRRARRAVS